MGKATKHRGSARSRVWQRQQVVWWQGKAMDRHGGDYQAFLDRAYDAMAEQSEPFRRALLATQNAVLTHSLGKTKETDTVLTEREFCSRLMKIRDRLQVPSSYERLWNKGGGPRDRR